MTDTNQLPPLPTLRPGDSHMESLIEAAIQGHASTREAMRWLVRQLVPATQPAEVTDEQVAEALESAGVELQRFMGGISGTKDVWTTAGSQSVRRIAAGVRAILALRPVQVPMTDEQWLEYLLKHANNTTLSVAASVGQSLQTRGRWVLLQPANDLRKLVERAYGITAQAKKETP